MYPTLGRLAHRASRQAPSRDRGVLWRPALTEDKENPFLFYAITSRRVDFMIRGGQHGLGPFDFRYS